MFDVAEYIHLELNIAVLHWTVPSPFFKDDPQSSKFKLSKANEMHVLIDGIFCSKAEQTGFVCSALLVSISSDFPRKCEGLATSLV